MTFMCWNHFPRLQKFPVTKSAQKRHSHRNTSTTIHSVLNGQNRSHLSLCNMISSAKRNIPHSLFQTKTTGVFVHGVVPSILTLRFNRPKTPNDLKATGTSILQMLLPISFHAGKHTFLDNLQPSHEDVVRLSQLGRGKVLVKPHRSALVLRRSYFSIFQWGSVVFLLTYE